MKRARARVPAARVTVPEAAPFRRAGHSGAAQATAVAPRPSAPTSPAPAATPASVRAILHEAMELHQAGDLARAEQAYRRVLQLRPNEPDALHLLGLLAHQVGCHDVAVGLITRAIGIWPRVAIFHGHLGDALQALGRTEEAVKSYGLALTFDPGHLMIHNNLGNALQVLGRYDEAVARYRRVLAIRDDFAVAHANLGAVLQAQGKLEDSLACAERALALSPDSAAAHNNRAVILQSLWRREEAVEAYRRAIELDPGYATARTNLANTLHALDRLDEAYAYAREAVDLAPGEANGHNTLGNALRELGRLGEAADAYRAGLELQPASLYLHSNLIFVLDLTAGAAEAAWTERRRFNERHAVPLAAAGRPHQNAPDPERRLRVGYVSADFRRHSAAYATLPILQAHDPARVEVTCYSSTLNPDDLTERFRAAAHRWRDVAVLTDDELAEQVRADDVDVLVDLSGHSAGHRLLAFARRPAPVQVSAWGYAAGTGLDAMDYVFADPVTVPTEARRYYREQVVELPAVLCYQPPADAPDVAPLPASTRGYVTFGSFNRPAKLTDETLALWARVLHVVPDSRLLLKFGGLDAGAAHDRILAALVAAGIEPERVELRGGTPQRAHLAAYGEIDLALDPVPQGGGITALEGIWMGVPPITLLGERIPGRVAGSLLHALGLPELVASTSDEYVEAAARAAADLDRLAALRFDLRARLAASPVGDPRQYVHAVEDAYRTIWRRWCADTRPGREASPGMKRARVVRAARPVSPSPACGRGGRGVRASTRGVRAASDVLAAAFRHHQAGRLAEAEPLYRQVLAACPEQPDALHLLGVLAHQAGRHAAAAELIERAVAVGADEPSFHASLGLVLHALGQTDEAIVSLRRAADGRPADADVHNNLGALLQLRGRSDEAAASFRRAVALDPAYAEAHNNLGTALQALGELDEAVRCFERAIEQRPAYAEAHQNLGIALHCVGALDAAEASLRRAVELAPGAAEALNGLGAVQRDQGRFDAAVATYRRALVVRPEYVAAHSNLIFALDLHPATTAAEAHAERRRWNERHAAPLAVHVRPHANDRDPERRLRVGYVSADFRRHSAAYATLPILEAHDPARVEVTCYSEAPREDDLTARFRASAARWRPARGLTDAALADLIRADRIDVLVDLSGYSAGNRLLAFARKPAPVQVTAWGYATGTGLDAMDYFFADAVAVPEEARRWYAEEVVHLPSLLCYAPPADAPDVAPPPMLARGYPTFGSFNRPAKLALATLTMWAGVLRAVPDARLMLKFGGLDNAAGRGRILAALAAHGVEPARVELRGNTAHAEHLAAYADVDVALDPFPHGGGITALEGLWMGVPLVTRLGATVPGRVAGTFLTTAGLADLVTESAEAYVATAARLAGQPERLAHLRGGLRSRLAGSPIADPPRYARAVEDAYRTIWRRWCARGAV